MYRLINQQTLQPRLGRNNIQGLPDLEDASALAEPVLAQDLGPALEGVHFAGGSVEVAFLEEDLCAGEDGLDVAADGEPGLLEEDLGHGERGEVGGYAGVFGEQGGLADLGGDAAEAVDEEGGGGDAALVGGGVDAGDGGCDDGVVGGDLLEGSELGDEGLGDDLGLEGGLDGLDGDDEMLGLEVGVDDRVPLGGELLELVDRVGEIGQLAEATVALGLDAVADALGEVLLEVDALLEELVLELGLVDLVCGVELRLDLAAVGLLQALALVLVLLLPVCLLLLHLVVEALDELLGGLVELGVGCLDLVLGLLLQTALEQGDVGDDLGQIRLGLVEGRVVLAAVGLVGVDDGDEVVDDLDHVLDDGLAGRGDAQVVDLSHGCRGGGLNHDRRRGSRRSSRSGLLPLLVLLLGLLDALGRGVLVGADPRLVCSLGLGVVVADGAGVGVLGNARGQAALAGDGDLLLARDLLVQTRLLAAGREAALELALLKVGDGILAKGHELGEEVVEVVRHERVVDAAGIAETRQDGQPQQEATEAALLRLGLGLNWVGGDARRARAGRGRGRGLDDGGSARGRGRSRGRGRGRGRGRVGGGGFVHDGRRRGGRGAGHLRRRDGRLLDRRRVCRVDGGLDERRWVGDGRLVQLFVVGVPALGRAPCRRAGGSACQWPGSRTGRKNRGAQHAGTASGWRGWGGRWTLVGSAGEATATEL